MLLPGILSYEGIPHSLRCIGAIPPVFIFSGIAGEFLYRKLRYSNILKNVRMKKIVIFASILLLFSFTFAQYQRYFIVWAENPETKNAFSYDYVKIGRYLNTLTDETKKYVIVNQSGVLVDGIPMPAQTVMFIERTKNPKREPQGKTSWLRHNQVPYKPNKEQETIYLLPEDISQIQTKPNTVIVLMRC